MRRYFLVALALGCVVSATARAAPSPDLSCTFRHPVEEVGDIIEVPPQIQGAILARIDPAAREDAKFQWHRLMAPRDGAFDAAPADAPSRRFIRAGHDGSDWFVWFAHAEPSPAKVIALFHIRLGHANPIVRALVSYGAENPCALTDELLDNKPPPPGSGAAW